jgi:hypothetical protein
MRILEHKIQKIDLLDSEVVFDGPMVKAVVDLKRGLVGIDANMHADIEQMLLSDGSNQDDLWGINLYPGDDGEDFIEFDSMINIRPRQGNKSRFVEDEKIRNEIVALIKEWIVDAA